MIAPYFLGTIICLKRDFPNSTFHLFDEFPRFNQYCQLFQVISKRLVRRKIRHDSPDKLKGFPAPYRALHCSQLSQKFRNHTELREFFRKAFFYLFFIFSFVNGAGDGKTVICESNNKFYYIAKNVTRTHCKKASWETK